MKVHKALVTQKQTINIRLLVGLKIGAATMEENMEVPQKN